MHSPHLNSSIAYIALEREPRSQSSAVFWKQGRIAPTLRTLCITAQYDPEWNTKSSNFKGHRLAAAAFSCTMLFDTAGVVHLEELKIIPAGKQPIHYSATPGDEIYVSTCSGACTYLYSLPNDRNEFVDGPNILEPGDRAVADTLSRGTGNFVFLEKPK